MRKNNPFERLRYTSGTEHFLSSLHTFTHNNLRQNGACHKLLNRTTVAMRGQRAASARFYSFGLFFFSFSGENQNCFISTRRTSTWCKSKSISSAIPPLPCFTAFFHQITYVFIPNTYSDWCATHTNTYTPDHKHSRMTSCLVSYSITHRNQQAKRWNAVLLCFYFFLPFVGLFHMSHYFLFIHKMIFYYFI